MKNWVKWLGKSAVAIGCCVAIMAFLPGYFGLLALMLMIPGFIISTAYIMISARAEIEQRINPGYVGLALSSLPLMLIIYFTFFRG
jgi:hypothetical protein